LFLVYFGAVILVINMNCEIDNAHRE